MIPEHFLFLRPLWLLMLLPAALAVYATHRVTAVGNSSHWAKLVDSHLLQHMAVHSHTGKTNHWPIYALALALTAASLAMAGPAWQRMEQPAFKASNPVVLVLSLAQSMNATDVSPSRLIRAGHKIKDILAHDNSSEIGLVVYSDQPFVASPLTTDAKVIGDMLPELSTTLMPVLGNRLDLAIDQASLLLVQAGARTGQILVIADDAGDLPVKANSSAMAAAHSGYTVNVLGVGTTEGADLQTESGQRINGTNGQTLTTSLDLKALDVVTKSGNGHLVSITADSTDVDQLLTNSESNVVAKSSWTADAWNDMGYWLLLIPVLLAPLAFRKNVLLVLPVFVALNLSTGISPAEAATTATTLQNDKTLPATSSAGTGRNSDQNGWWQTPDQQGAQKFADGDFQGAATTFTNPDWEASASYRAGEYEQAATNFGNNASSFDEHYNHGNALAKSGMLEDALAAYDSALKLKPDDADAIFNRELVAQLIEEQKQDEQDQQQSGGEQQEQDQEQSGGEQQEQDQQQSGGEQQEQDQQQSGGEQQEQDQEQSGGEQQEQDQQQSGGEQQEQDQQQAGGEQQEQDKQQAGGELQEQDQQQGGGEQQDQDQQQGGGEQQDQDQQQAGGEQLSDQNEGKSAFQKAMDELLRGNGDSTRPPEQETPVEPELASAGLTEQQQSLEQELRSVPDDPTGLLRARIRQHYLNQRNGS